MTVSLGLDPETPQWECVLDARAALGEIPVWASDHQALFWIDLYAPALHMLSFPERSTMTWPLPATGGSFALYEDGRHVLLAIEDGLHRLELRSGHLDLLQPAPYDPADYRFNDGKCDQRGRFWVGTAKHRAADPPDGTSRFWCFDRDEIRDGIDSITVANGLTFSPDGRTMYVADRPTWQILAFDYDVETGRASGRRRFASVPVGHIPDGAAVDRDGNYWIALFGVGLIACYAPDGQLARALRAPTTHPTMVTFGGPGLRTMFLTTARHFLDADGLQAEPLAGGVFSCDVGVVGLEDHRYRPPTAS